MKKLTLLIILFSTIFAQAQDVRMKESVATQLIFPANIEHFRGGFNPDDFIKPQQYTNSLYLQPLGTFEDTNINVVTEDGFFYSIKLCYSDTPTQFFVVTKDMAIYNKRGEVNNVQVTTEPTTDVITKILGGSGFIATRNAVKYKSLMLSIIGIYSVEDKIYLRFEIQNTSQIPYEIEHLGFTLKTRPSVKMSSEINEVLEPKINYCQNKIILGKKTTQAVFGFDKFTVGSENILLVELIEKGGARNVALQITDEFILTAKPL